jgi:hypothetical protein
LVLAVFGFTALAWQLGRALFATMRSGVEVFVARQAAELRAREGDLTGLAEAEARGRSAGRVRRRALGRAAFWLGLLALPPLTPLMIPVYAACSLLWLMKAEALPPAIGGRTAGTRGGGRRGAGRRGAGGPGELPADTESEE